MDNVQRMAAHNVALLAPYAQQGIPIVGCEPSCLSMLADDYRDLVPGEDSETIARLVQPLDAFIAAEMAAGRVELAFDETPRHVLFHGHCQQKATFSTAGTLAMLSSIPNCTVEEVDSSCCGMAGSFGYEAEHYDLSIKLVERSLAPAVRNADAQTIICAAGTSCRDQINHTTPREAIHPLEVFASALQT